MNKSKIDWLRNPDGSQGFTWNPVTGCLHGCSYCYAKRIADRFKPTRKESALIFDEGHLKYYSDDRVLWEADRLAGAFPASFLPTFYPHRLTEPIERKKPTTIFVCSMADLFGKWVPSEWIEAVLDIVRACPQHTFIFLTKNPERYGDFFYAWDHLFHPIYIGATATSQASWDRAIGVLEESSGSLTNYFISAEPLLAPIKPRFIGLLNWIIIGADSTRGAASPERKWGDVLIEAARSVGVPVFVKKNWPWAFPATGEYEWPKEFPEGVSDGT